MHERWGGREREEEKERYKPVEVRGHCEKLGIFLLQWDSVNKLRSLGFYLLAGIFVFLRQGFSV